MVSVIRLPVQYTTHETQPRVTIFVNERRHFCTPVAKALSVPLSTGSPHEGTSAQNSVLLHGLCPTVRETQMSCVDGNVALLFNSCCGRRVALQVEPAVLI